MALSDSMFLIEIIVEDLTSYIACKEFRICSQFANVFSLVLNDPNQSSDNDDEQSKKEKRKRLSVRGKGERVDEPSLHGSSGKSLLFSCDINVLMDLMIKYDLQLSLFNQHNVHDKVGYTFIPWNNVFINYLHNLYYRRNKMIKPVSAMEEYNVFDEITSKRMAQITLNIKLTYISDTIISSFQTLSKSGVYQHSEYLSILSTIREILTKAESRAGVITTNVGGHRCVNCPMIYSHNNNREITSEQGIQLRIHGKDEITTSDGEHVEAVNNLNKVNASVLSLIKSDTDLNINRQLEIVKSKSCSKLTDKQMSILSYIFGNINGPFGNQVYCVGYFSVHNDEDGTSSKSPEASPGSKSPPKGSTGTQSPAASNKSADTGKNTESTDSKKKSVCSGQECKKILEKDEEMWGDEKDKVVITRCTQPTCLGRIYNEPPPPRDDRILLRLKSKEKDTCPDTIEKVETITGGMKANVKMSKDSCYCTCECTFGIQKTTYCKICKGFEFIGEDMTGSPDDVFPCPIYYNLQKDKPPVTARKSEKNKNIESDKSTKITVKCKKKIDDRFKFNYGYTAPQIGHGLCAAPCTGTLGNVPKNMGWLWTAEDVPGMKFRANWKPGCINKHVLRLLRMARNPGQVVKKRRRDTGKKKKPLKRPLLVVHKKEGEFAITMETMRQYTKPRAINQIPYEDKDVLTYTIGRTEEENAERRKKRERAQRRLEREQRDFIQSAFKDMCKEICLKTYQQALGLLPDAEDPACACYPAVPGPDRTNLDWSCSCTEDSASLCSDTDNDEWMVEFTPPVALFDQSFKSKKVLKVDNSTQYTYLDYRVKLLDRYGNQVPRFFKYLDGKTLCSDLGGFWDPNKKWLEINIDGYIAPDGRWAPMNFMGPHNDQVDAETGKFISNGTWYVVGIDGYVDANNKWRRYLTPKAKPRIKTPKPKVKRQGGAGDKKDKKKLEVKPSRGTWSCFGDVDPVELSKLGIVGHGQDKKLLLSTLKTLRGQGQKVNIPMPSTVPRLPPHVRELVKRRMMRPNAYNSRTYFSDRSTCKHPTPSDKGIVAVNDRGNKTYFKLKSHKNLRPNQRQHDLVHQGISLSSFHVPCLRSFIDSETLKQQLRTRRVKLYQNAQTQSHTR